MYREVETLSAMNGFIGSNICYICVCFGVFTANGASLVSHPVMDTNKLLLQLLCTSSAILAWIASKHFSPFFSTNTSITTSSQTITTTQTTTNETKNTTKTCNPLIRSLIAKQ